MEAAAIGARSEGGHTIGIMPGRNAPNAGIDHAVLTDMGDGRNFLNAAVPDAMIALYGEAGTLSEIGLALKMGTPLVYLAAWKFLNDNGLPVRPYVTTPEEAVTEAFKALGIEPRQKLDRPLKAPAVRDQTENLTELAHVVAGW
jgi:predicted Rossmann-fold nucleotide-binding protein